MKEVNKYICEVCNTEYKNKSDAADCEKNHKIKLKIKDKKYLPLNMDNSGYPLNINVEFEDGKVIKYKRG